MDGNKLTLLKLLIEADDYIAYDKLAESLQVSSRTIIRFMKEIQDYVKPFHIVVDVKKRRGVRLLGEDSEILLLKESWKDEKGYTYTSGERMILIMMELFTNTEYTKIYYLAYSLNVSITTIHHDIIAIENYVALNHLKIDNQRGLGMKLKGKRKDIVWAIAGFLAPYMEWEDHHISYHYLLSSDVQARMEQFFSLHTLQNVKMLMDEFDYTLRSIFVLEDYHHFIILNTILIQYQDYFSRYPETDYNELICEHQIHLRFREFMKKVTISYGANSIREEESNLYVSAYLAMRKIGTKMDSYQYDEELYHLTLRFLSDVEADLHRSLNRNTDLIDRLAIHMKLVIHRIRIGTLIHNSYVDEVKKKYPLVFEAVKRHLYLLENRYALSINDNEAGYITIHVLATMMEQENNTKMIKTGVLCMSGMGTSRMLVETIRLHYPLLQIDCGLSLDDFDELSLIQQGYDLIISTITLETITLPCIVVHPIMRDQDFNRISKRYNEFVAQRQIKIDDYEPSHDVKSESKVCKAANRQEIIERMAVVSQVIEQFSVCAIRCESFDEVLDQIASDQITKENQNAFKQKIYLREKLGSTLINTMNFILIHCRLQDEMCLKLYTMEGGFLFHTEESEQRITNALVMVAPQNNHSILLEVMSQVSMSIAVDQVFQSVIMKGNEEEIIRYLTHIVLKLI